MIPTPTRFITLDVLVGYLRMAWLGIQAALAWNKSTKPQRNGEA